VKSSRAILAIGATLLLGAGIAQADLVQKGNIRIAFNGGIAPAKLPRAQQAPISVQLGAKVKTTDRTEVPTLTRILLEINRHGTLTTRGLPRCSISKIDNSNSQVALARCRGALVGNGNVTTRITLPSQGTFASNGKLYAFNGRVNGKPGILAQVHASRPLPLTFVIPFQITAGKGTFGTKLLAKVPPIASGNGRISSFDITLKRNFAKRGKRHSYMAANCPLPSGFRAGSFDFARATYSFEDGRSLTSVLTKECQIRK
jgi:hypothetical protein